VRGIEETHTTVAATIIFCDKGREVLQLRARKRKANFEVQETGGNARPTNRM